MKITYCSDLHVEFGALDKPMPKGDVLILAGDITLLGLFDADSLYHKNVRLRERTMALLGECKANFDRIFYLIGNHEFYQSNISLAARIVRKNLPGVTLLENKAVDLGDDVILVGGTLWTDMNAGQDCHIIRRAMNDFSVVRVRDRRPPPATYNGTRAFQPEDAMKLFAQTKRLIAKTAKANPDKCVVIATHHAPSPHGISTSHVRTSHINHGYFTDLHDFIADHPNIRHWIHGHTHLQKAYTVAQCRVVSNARGYIGHEMSAETFDPDCWFDPVTGKRKEPGRATKRTRERATA